MLAAAQSRKEQGYGTGAAPALPSGTEAEKLAAVLAELGQLNDAYEARLGFKFVVFVNGRPKDQIIPVIKERMLRSPEVELATGLA
jgi:2-oxo-4-hydroxy-4-carboxy--5-ureidoimidazoline (OHCU) decarboxylase